MHGSHAWSVMLPINDSGGCPALQTLQELVDTAVQSEAPHTPQLVINPNWLTGAGTDPQEVWRALQSLGIPTDTLICAHCRFWNLSSGCVCSYLACDWCRQYFLSLLATVTARSQTGNYTQRFM